MEVVELVAEFKAKVEALVAEKEKIAFDSGVASVPVTPGGFTQEQVDALVAAAVAEKDKEIEQLKAEKADLEANADAKVSEAVAAFKADLLAKYEEQQVAETQAETGFKDLLK